MAADLKVVGHGNIKFLTNGSPGRDEQEQRAQYVVVRPPVVRKGEGVTKQMQEQDEKALQSYVSNFVSVIRAKVRGALSHMLLPFDGCYHHPCGASGHAVET